MHTSNGEHQTKRPSVHCTECRSSSGLYWHGWRAVRIDDPELDEPPALAFYCPACALVEFGLPRRRPLEERRRRPRA